MSKHEKIYELTGVQPQLWYDPSNDTFSKTKTNLMVAKLLDNNKEFKYNLEFRCPHYPCEQLWGMVDIKWEDKKSDTGYWRFKPGRIALGFNSYPNLGSNELISFRIDNNLQEALLDMVLWAIENGQVKKVSE
jgi:hypothetical protein